VANIKSSKKDVRRTKRRSEANSQKKSRLRTLDKKIRNLVAEGEISEAQNVFKSYSSYLDRAGKRNLIHQSQASRRKSRMAALLNSTGSVSEPSETPEPTQSEEVSTEEEAAV